jgi:branched-chain amino acid transport system ATP-binding protein
VATDLERVYGYFPAPQERPRSRPARFRRRAADARGVARADAAAAPDAARRASFGLAPLIVRELFEILRTINQKERVSMLLVEQNAAMALDSPTTPT